MTTDTMRREIASLAAELLEYMRSMHVPCIVLIDENNPSATAAPLVILNRKANLSDPPAYFADHWPITR